MRRRREPFSQITTVLFDAGGVLIHPDYFWLRKILRGVGKPVNFDDIRRAEYVAKAAIDRAFFLNHLSTDEDRRTPYFEIVLKELGLEPSFISSIMEAVQDEHGARNLWRHCLPSTPKVLTALREKGVRLGVVSNADGRVAVALKRVGLFPFFEVIVDSAVVAVEKPDTRIFEIALKGLGVLPETTLFVGDIYSVDIVGAERAQLHPVLLDTLSSYRGVTCAKITHLRELLVMVETTSDSAE